MARWMRRHERAADAPTAADAAGTVAVGGGEEGRVAGSLPRWVKDLPIDLGALRTSAAAFAAGMWSRSCAGARVIASPGVADAVHAILADGAWQLIEAGEAAWAITLDAAGEPRLLPAGWWQINGDADPDTWAVTATLTGPSGQTFIRGPEAAFAFWRWRTAPGRPWAGVGPLDSASESAALVALAERHLRDIAGGPTGQLLRMSNIGGGQDAAALDELGDDLAVELDRLRGEVALLVTGTGLAPGGYNVTEAMASTEIGTHTAPGDHAAWKDAWRHLVMACGIPPGLIDTTGANATRDSMRQWLAASVAPMLRRLADELGRKLGEPIAFDLADLKLADLTARARSFASLINAGADFATAAAEVGLGPDLKPTPKPAQTP